MRDSLSNRSMLAKLAATGAVRALGAIFGFLLNVIIARQLGPADAGRFFLGLTLMTVVSQFTRFGFPVFLLRDGSIFWESKRLGALRATYWKCARDALILSVVVAAVLFGARDWLAESVIQKPEISAILAAFCLTLVPFTLLWVNSGMLKAISSPVLANLTESGLVPVLAVALMFMGGTDTAIDSALIYLLVCVVVVALSTVAVFRRVRPPSGETNVAPAPGAYAFGAAATVVAVLNYLTLWLPFLVLGRVATAEDLGGYSVAQRTVMVVGMVTVVVNSIYLPQFARTYARLDPRGIRKALRNSVLLTIGGAGLPVLVMAVLPAHVLALFGHDFIAAALPLQILAACYFLSLLFGPTDEVLLMFGSTAVLRNIGALVLAAELILVALWIPSGLGVAAAWITGGSLFVRRLLTWIWVKKAIHGMERT